MHPEAFDQVQMRNSCDKTAKMIQMRERKYQCPQVISLIQEKYKCGMTETSMNLVKACIQLE